MTSKKSENSEALLRDDHEELSQLLGTLQEALDSHDFSAAFVRLDLFWARLAMHIRAEHLHLFPSILKSANTETIASIDAHKVIEQLRSDHDFFMHELSSAVKILREAQATGGTDSDNALAAVGGIITAVSDRLKLHNELEEEIMYLLPERMLTLAEQVTLGEKIRVELETIPPRFKGGSNS